MGEVSEKAREKSGAGMMVLGGRGGGLACHLGRRARLRANDRPRKPISLAIATAMNTPALLVGVRGRWLARAQVRRERGLHSDRSHRELDSRIRDVQ